MQTAAPRGAGRSPRPKPSTDAARSSGRSPPPPTPDAPPPEAKNDESANAALLSVPQATSASAANRAAQVLFDQPWHGPASLLGTKGTTSPSAPPSMGMSTKSMARTTPRGDDAAFPSGRLPK